MMSLFSPITSKLWAIIGALGQSIDDRLHGARPVRILAGTAGMMLLVDVTARLWEGTPQTWRLRRVDRLRKTFFQCLWAIPPLKRRLNAHMDKARGDFAASLRPPADTQLFLALPAKSLAKEEILRIMDTRQTKLLKHPAWQGGTTTGTVYNGSDATSDIIMEAYRRCLWSNQLHAQSFPNERLMEAEVIKMTIDLYRGGSSHAGMMTSGGTESILVTMRAYREHSREERGIHAPNIVACRTAHPAFEKAADNLGIAIVYTAPLRDSKADVRAMLRAADCNTVCFIASAPSYGWGVIDDIPTLAAGAKRMGIPVHVDACLGSFVVPFLAELKYHEFPAFDFSVEGVTSITCDTHKYGFGPKGTSIAMFRNAALRRAAFYSSSDFPGGIYATPCMAGSRSGGIAAAQWAVMMHLGRDGYRAEAAAIVALVRRVTDAIARIPGIVIPTWLNKDAPASHGLTQAVPFTCSDADPFAAAELMQARGWELACCQFPSSVHWGVTAVATRRATGDQFVSDLTEVMAELLARPAAERAAAGALKMYGSTQAIPDRSLVKGAVVALIEAGYDAVE